MSGWRSLGHALVAAAVVGLAAVAPADEPERVDPRSFQVSPAAALGTEHGLLLVGYDVEHQDPAEPELTRTFLERAVALHRELEAPATFFVLGWTLELNRDAFAAIADDPLFEIQTHTWGHERLKTVVEERPDGVAIHPASPVETVTASLARARTFMSRAVGRPPWGLTAPWGYYRGLADRPDLLALLDAAGIRYVRSWGRDEHGWQPVPLDVQPFFYELQGYPTLLEIPMQGWQDALWRERHGWDDLDGYRAVLAGTLDEVASRNLAWSHVAHDWSSLRGDPELTLLRGLLEGARERGVRIATHGELYRAALERLRPEQGAFLPAPDR